MESKTKEMDLADARGNARSFPGSIPPPGAKEIGREKIGQEEYIYYSDGKGSYWYNTKSQIALEMEIQEAMNKRKRKNRRH